MKKDVVNNPIRVPIIMPISVFLIIFLNRENITL
jgi:hypothetical protein